MNKPESQVVSVQALIEALEFYASLESWAYTTYDNYHTMHDDAGTVKFPGGSIVDMSGDRARKALKHYREDCNK